MKQLPQVRLPSDLSAYDDLRQFAALLMKTTPGWVVDGGHGVPTKTFSRVGANRPRRQGHDQRRWHQ